MKWWGLALYLIFCALVWVATVLGPIAVEQPGDIHFHLILTPLVVLAWWILARKAAPHVALFRPSPVAKASFLGICFLVFEVLSAVAFALSIYGLIRGQPHAVVDVVVTVLWILQFDLARQFANYKIETTESKRQL